MSSELDATNDYFSSFVPDEVLEHNIFKYFIFNKCIAVFSLVCKRWKRICDHSTLDPKQITLRLGETIDDVGQIIMILKKYQPTILHAKMNNKSEFKFIVSRMCEASKRLNTLVLELQNPVEIDTYVKPMQRITTLAISTTSTNKKFWSNIFKLFPNLKRLHLESSKLAQIFKEHREVFEKLEELTLEFEAIMSSSEVELTNPEVTLIETERETVKKKPKMSNEFKKMKLTYDEYFRYFGKTKLYSALERKKCKKAARLLEQETSMEYERKLHEDCFEYEYPTSMKKDQFSLDAYCATFMKSEEAYNTLVATNQITVPAYLKFNVLLSFSRTEEALVEFGKLEEHELALVKKTFFRELLPKVTKKALRRKSIIKNVKKIVFSGVDDVATAKDFNKISDLRADWSDQVANAFNAGICCAMIKKGCKIDVEKMHELSRIEDLDISPVVGLVKKMHPSELVNTLLRIAPNLTGMIVITDEHNISLTLEKDGKSLFNIWIGSGAFSVLDVADYADLVNHMDSKGITPLHAALKYSKHEQVWPMVVKLLEVGADPNKFRGDKLSPLALVLDRRFDYIHEVTNFINLLVEYGVDVNTPCLFQDWVHHDQVTRMCSPLMIAVLNATPVEIIRLLIILGARIDYVDETGRTILECAASVQRLGFPRDSWYPEVCQLLK